MLLPSPSRTALAAAGALVVVVTNAASPGASRAWLAGVGLVLRDHGGPVTAVIDSSEVGVAKPDPAILHLAPGAAGWNDHDLQRVAFVGDSLRLDGKLRDEPGCGSYTSTHSASARNQHTGTCNVSPRCSN